MGFRTDVSEILRACDCFVFPSFREGLSVSLMEAMAAGLPCIASRIRGNVDLLEESRYLFEPADESALCQLLKDAANGVQTEQECARNREMLKRYDIENVSKEMRSIYSAVIEGTTTHVSTIEGNSSDGVRRKTYNLYDPSIDGYGEFFERQGFAAGGKLFRRGAAHGGISVRAGAVLSHGGRAQPHGGGGNGRGLYFLYGFVVAVLLP